MLGGCISIYLYELEGQEIIAMDDTMIFAMYIILSA